MLSLHQLVSGACVISKGEEENKRETVGRKSKQLIAGRKREGLSRIEIQMQKRYQTYSSWDSHVVTHRSTNQPVNCLCMAERTGCPVFSCLWPYVDDKLENSNYNL